MRKKYNAPTKTYICSRCRKSTYKWLTLPFAKYSKTNWQHVCFDCIEQLVIQMNVKRFSS